MTAFLRIPSSCLLAAVLSLGSGCASIVNGQNQSVSVETRTPAGPVSGAQCKLSNNKGTWFLTSPGSATVNRSYENLAVRCEKESLEPGLASVQSSTKPMAFGNILFGGIIGAGVDMSTGAAYDYPSLITVIMGSSTDIKASTPAASASPAVAPTPGTNPPSAPPAGSVAIGGAPAR
jgi:hypothetical protein